MPPQNSINLLPENDRPDDQTRPWWKRRSFYFASALCATVIVIGSIALYSIGQGWWFTTDPVTGKILTSKNHGILQAVKNFIFNNEAQLEGQTDDRINILLLGIGGSGHDGPYLSDTNIVLSIKPSTKQVALISIPRDLGVQIPTQGWRKINYADAYGEALQSGGGGDYARKIFENTLDLSIPYYVRVDFKAFAEMIDAVGGVTVVVPKTFTDSAFPASNSAGIDTTAYQTVSFTAGEQTMDGVRALQFARSRHGNNGEGSDFARARRQQLILSALKEKLLSFGTYTNPLVIQKILSSLASHVSTNLTIDQFIYLGGVAKEINGTPKTLVLDDSVNGYLMSTIADSGAYLLFPKTGNYDKINAAVSGIFDSTSTPPIASAPATSTVNQSIFPSLRLEVKNGTWRAGLASRAEKQLEENGFAVIAISNNPKRPIAKTTIYVIQDALDKTALQALQTKLGAVVSRTLPDWLTESYDDPRTTDSEVGAKYNAYAEAVIVLGEDYKE